MSTLKKLEQIIQNGTPILQELKDASKSAHIASRDTAWEFYTDWRDSSEGQKWKQQKQLDCKNTCPECGKVET